MIQSVLACRLRDLWESPPLLCNIADCLLTLIFSSHHLRNINASLTIHATHAPYAIYATCLHPNFQPHLADNLAPLHAQKLLLAHTTIHPHIFINSIAVIIATRFDQISTLWRQTCPAENLYLRMRPRLRHPAAHNKHRPPHHPPIL